MFAKVEESKVEEREEIASVWVMLYTKSYPEIETQTSYVLFLLLSPGVIIFLTSSDEQTQGVYLMVMGGASSFFVCWHSVALCTGAYIKSKNSDDKNYFILRVCNFGAFFLMIAGGVVSYLVWTEINNIVDNFTVLQGIVIGFLIIMYVMVLYCFVECLFDSCSILKSSFQEQPAPVPASYRRNPTA